MRNGPDLQISNEGIASVGSAGGGRPKVSARLFMVGSLLMLTACGTHSASSDQSVGSSNIPSSGAETTQSAEGSNPRVMVITPPAGDPMTITLSDRTFDVTDYTFWQLHGEPLTIGEEKDPPGSMAELAQRSDVVIKFRILSVKKAPELDDEYKVTTLTIEDVSHPGATYTFDLSHYSGSGVTFDDIASLVPSGEYVLFAQQDGASNELRCSSGYYCVYGADEAGKIIPVLAADRARDVPAPGPTLDDIISAYGTD